MKASKIIAITLLISGIFVISFVNTSFNNAKAEYSVEILKNFWPAPMANYPQAKIFPLSDSMTVTGSKLKMAWFRIADEPYKIAMYYSRIWKNKGYFVTENVHPMGGRVSAVDPGSNLLRQIVMIKQGKKTTVFISMNIGKMQHLNSINASSKTSLPVYPGAEGILAFDSSDKMATSTVITYVDREDVKSNVSFYIQQMTAKGYSLSKQNDEFHKLPGVVKDTVQILIFNRNNEEVTVTIAPVPGSKRTRVHIAKMRGKGE